MVLRGFLLQQLFTDQLVLRGQLALLVNLVGQRLITFLMTELPTQQFLVTACLGLITQQQRQLQNFTLLL
jgi:hypothetical protein